MYRRGPSSFVVQNRNVGWCDRGMGRDRAYDGGKDTLAPPLGGLRRQRRRLLGTTQRPGVIIWEAVRSRKITKDTS